MLPGRPRRVTALPRATWEHWVAAGRELEAVHREHMTTVAERFNAALDHVGRAIGHRVFQAILQYVAQYPSFDEADQAFEEALADVFAQKLMPKLGGIECRSSAGRACLDEVEGVLPAELRDAFTRARAGEYFTWQGSRSGLEEEARRPAAR
jgi:hypothetical protein